MSGLLLALSCSFAQPVPTPVDNVIDSSAKQFDEYYAGDTLSVMSSQGIGEQTLLRLLKHPDVRPVQEVIIREQLLTSKAVEALMSADSTAGIHSLHLSGNPLGDAGLQVLAHSARLSQIQTLHLQNVGATANGLAALAGSSHLKAKTLALGWQEVGDAGAKALTTATEVSQLRLEQAQVGTAGAVALIEHGQFESLSLINNPAHLTGLTAISPRLKSLHLVECPLSLEDVQALSTANAPGLTELSLKGSAVDDAGLEAIASAPWFGQLTSLVVSANKASADSRRAFIAAYGDNRFLSIYKKDL